MNGKVFYYHFWEVMGSDEDWRFLI